MFFDDIFVKDLIVNQSYYGDQGYYSFTLTTYNSIGINIPIAEDLKLVLNPTTVGTTEIPVSFNYSWIILRYIQDFSLDSFDNAVKSVLEILFDLAEITPEELLRETLFALYPNINALETFINDLNTKYGTNIQVNSNALATTDTKISQVVEEVQELDMDMIQVVYETAIEIDDEGLIRLKKVFNRLFDNIEENFKEAIALNFTATINELSLGLQFPRKWLVPVYTGVENVTGLAINEPLPEPYFSIVKFNAGSLIYGSRSGFEFNKVSSFSLNRSMIGKTGLIAEFTNLKVDLYKDRNIPEAIADGRSEDFKGVYAEYVGITLPPKWFNNVDNSTLRIASLISYVGGNRGNFGYGCS